MPLSGFFITGTDTGVGKTAIGAALLYLSRRTGKTGPDRGSPRRARRPGDLPENLRARSES